MYPVDYRTLKIEEADRHRRAALIAQASRARAEGAFGPGPIRRALTWLGGLWSPSRPAVDPRPTGASQDDHELAA